MSKESIYDEQINPLMSRVIAICKEHKIACLCDFALDEDLKCTTALLSDDYGPTENQLRALSCLQPKSTFIMAETIETGADNSKKITLRRIR